MGSLSSSTDTPITNLKKKRIAPHPPLPRVVNENVVHEPPIDYDIDTPPSHTPERTQTPPPIVIIPPPPLPIVITEPLPINTSLKWDLHKLEDPIHSKLQLEVIKAAEARSRRVVNVESLISDRPKNSRDELREQLYTAIEERTKRRAKGTLKMTVKEGKNGVSMYYRAPNVKPVIQDTSNHPLSVISNSDWTPEQALDENKLGDGVKEPKEITSQGKTVPDFDPASNQAQSNKEKMKNAVKNVIGSISRSFGRLKNIKTILNSDEWEIHYPETYDKPSENENAIKVHHIEKRPAYAYHHVKEELVLLPDYDRIVVAEDGRKFREDDLLNVENPREKYVMVKPIIPGDEIKNTIKIHHERSENETIDREFEWIRKVDSEGKDGNPKPDRQQLPNSETPHPPSPDESESETASMKTDSDRRQSPQLDDSGYKTDNFCHAPPINNVPVYTNSLPGYMNPYTINPVMYHPYMPPYGSPYVMPPHMMNPAFITPGMSQYSTLEHSNPVVDPIAHKHPTITTIDIATSNSTIRAATSKEVLPSPVRYHHQLNHHQLNHHQLNHLQLNHHMTQSLHHHHQLYDNYMYHLLYPHHQLNHYQIQHHHLHHLLHQLQFLRPLDLQSHNLFHQLTLHRNMNFLLVP